MELDGIRPLETFDGFPKSVQDDIPLVENVNDVVVFVTCDVDIETTLASFDGTCFGYTLGAPATFTGLLRHFGVKSRGVELGTDATNGQ
jgi:hypothetical protein